jgi:ketosteroid isomerase-like protein
MSRANIETARRAAEAFAHGGIDEMRALLHPEVKVRVRVGEVYEGRGAAAEFFRDWRDAWDDYRIEAEQFLDAGDQVVAFFHQQGRGRVSGIDIDQRAAVVVRISGGLIIEWTTYGDRAQALVAAGLHE